MPDWRKRQVTTEWRDAVRRVLDEQGRGSQAELCRKIADTYGAKVKEGTISLLLKEGRQSSSKWVEPVSELLGIGLPPFDSHDGLMGELVSAAQDLTEEEKGHLVAIAKSMGKK